MQVFYLVSFDRLTLSEAGGVAGPGVRMIGTPVHSDLRPGFEGRFTGIADAFHQGSMRLYRDAYGSAEGVSGVTQRLPDGFASLASGATDILVATGLQPLVQDGLVPKGARITRLDPETGLTVIPRADWPDPLPVSGKADAIAGDGETTIVDAGGGDDRLTGKGGEDVLFGGTGRDRLSGGSGHDSLEGGVGRDTLIGGAGNDALIGDRTGIVGGGSGDVIRGGAGRDWIEGDGGRDRLSGGAGDDLVFGQSDADRLDGGKGDDLLLGGPGDDAIRGGAGRDTLDGEGGGDTLAGGAGADVFVIGRGPVDVVVDFEPGVDRIASASAYGDWSFERRESGTLATNDTGGAALFLDLAPADLTADAFTTDLAF